MVNIRKMQKQEAQEVKRIAQRAFGIVERWFVNTPKEAMVAEVDGKIVGGIIIKYITARGKKIAYFDEAFIDPIYQGRGIGRQLYKETTTYLWEQKCDALSALVKDDNVGSWKLFLNNGFSQITIREGICQLGILPMLLQYFTTPFWLGNGMEFYLAAREGEVEAKKVKTGQQIGLFMTVNLILMLLPALWNSVSFLLFISSYLALLSGGILFGYIGTLFSKRAWRYRLNSGGAALVFLINLIGIYPMVGNWYPDKYEDTKTFKKDMGISALCEWLFILAVTSGALIFQKNYIFCSCLVQVGISLLIYHILIFYPFEIYGGRRVYLWSKRMYVLLAGLSACLIVLANWLG